jgi:hypothetical protein
MQVLTAAVQDSSGIVTYRSFFVAKIHCEILLQENALCFKINYWKTHYVLVELT